MSKDIFVTTVSFGSMAKYRNDTELLLQWMEKDPVFNMDVANAWRMRTNAMEPGTTLPQMLKARTGQDISVPVRTGDHDEFCGFCVR
ncbi:MAG: hypothetical protein HQL19_07850 [Candidatus Omnitrophica bacterium]|nr:hypothetical protein [Candidatus Omnitrophota bacterium]